MRPFLALAVVTALAAGSALAVADEVTERRICINKWRSTSVAEQGSTRRSTSFLDACRHLPPPPPEISPAS